MKMKIKVPVCVSVTYHKELELELDEDFDTPDLYEASREKLYKMHKFMDDNLFQEDEWEVLIDE